MTIHQNARLSSVRRKELALAVLAGQLPKSGRLVPLAFAQRLWRAGPSGTEPEGSTWTSRNLVVLNGLATVSPVIARARARYAGWEFVHLCIDDALRVAVTGIFSGERPASAIAALRAAVAHYQSLGIDPTAA